MIYEIHTIFPPNINKENGPILLKKLRKLKAMWALAKEILGSEVDGARKIMLLTLDKRDALLMIL